MGWIGWLSNSLQAEEETSGTLISPQTPGPLADGSPCPAWQDPFCQMEPPLCLLCSQGTMNTVAYCLRPAQPLLPLRRLRSAAEGLESNFLQHKGEQK